MKRFVNSCGNAPRSGASIAAFHKPPCRGPGFTWSTFARQHGGGDELENLALACRRCNARKGPNLSLIDPETGQLAPLFHPRLDTWSEHFALVEHQIIGLTAEGCATASLLDMNDHDRIQLRAELAALGQDVI